MTDEYVLTMSEADFNILREVYNEAYEHGPARRREAYRNSLTRICRNVDKLTLSWLDKKQGEFA